MKKILYYSDCPFFAGCENMLVNFFGSEELSSEFELTFLYRYSERYEEGAKKRMDMSRSIPVNLVVEPEIKSIVTSDNKVISNIQTIVRYVLVFVVKYYSIWVNYKRLLPIIREQSPHLIHINNGGYPAATSCYAVLLAAKRCGVKNIVYMVNNMAMSYKSPIRWFDKKLDNIVKHQVTYFVNGSNNAGERLKSVLGLPASKQITIRNGIIPRPVTMSKSQFREFYGLSDDTFVFAEVANLEERKGHRVLLKAVRQIICNNCLQNFVVLIEGNGPLKEELASIIKDYNLGQVVRMIEVEQIYNLYNAIDVLILPSLYREDFPNTIIEAMGMGVPVIGTSIAGIPEQINDHETGLLIDPGDVNALVKAMIEMSTNKSLYDCCKQHSKQKFINNYTAEISVRNYIKLYHSMLNN